MIKLLLVEDDASLAYIEKTGLEDIIGGYTVTTATNGKEGLQAWQETNPDVIISDIDMPVMNGFEMVERIRETDQDVIIIFTSALTSPNDVKHLSPHFAQRREGWLSARHQQLREETLRA